MHKLSEDCFHLLSFLNGFDSISRLRKTNTARLPVFTPDNVSICIFALCSKAFAFSVIPYLQLYRLALRFAFPCGRITGNPTFRLITTDDLGSAFSPAALHLRRKRFEFPVLATHHFGHSLSASLAVCPSRSLSAVHFY